MKKSKLLTLIIIPLLFLTGCSDEKVDSNIPKRTFSSPENPITITLPIVLSETTLSHSPFNQLEDLLIFPNKEDNNKISLLNEPFNKNHISTTDVADFIDYSTDSLTLIDNTIYFANASNSNSLASINLTDKIYKNINSHNAHNLISSNNFIYYMNSSSNNQLFSYNTITQTTLSVTKDSIGDYLINGDFILYQNLSDNSNLYSIKTDGSQREKLTDFSVDSFTTFNNEIIAVNSSDNNNLYLVSPNNNQTKRISIMNAHKLKSYNNNLYYIDSTNGNFLYSLNVNPDTYEVSSSCIFKQGINDYFLSDTRIFIEKMSNVNNTYILPLNKEQ